MSRREVNDREGAERARGHPLPRIAAAFGLSADAFGRAVRAEQEPAGRLAAVMQAAALQDAFARVADPETRRRCLAFVEDAARGEALMSGRPG